MDAMEYREIQIEDMGILEGLWEEASASCASLTPHAGNADHRWRFEEFGLFLVRKALKGLLRIVVVIEPESGREIGFSIASLSRDGTGEVDAIWVSAGCQEEGVRDTLLRGAISWLKERGASRITATVSASDGELIRFFRARGFATRFVVMELLPEREGVFNQNPS